MILPEEGNLGPVEILETQVSVKSYNGSYRNNWNINQLLNSTWRNLGVQ